MAGPIVIDLTMLTTAQGFTIQGAAQVDETGLSVASAGDVNKDGYDDLIIGAHYADNGSGHAYVIYGGPTSSTTNIDLTSLTPGQGFVIQGDAAGDGAGLSVSSAGDVNKDGYDDIVVGAIHNGNGGTDAGAAYVLYGGSTATRTNIDLTTLTKSKGFVIQGDAAGDFCGWSVSSAGDVNNDGFSDQIVGALFSDTGGTNAGAAYVIYGGTKASRTNIDLTNLTLAQGFAIQGDADFDEAGYGVKAAGDVNKDGFGDLIVGAPYGDAGRLNAGQAYVIYGGTTASRTNIDLAGLTLGQGFVIHGAAAGDLAGLSVSSAGDVNNDGYSDLIVGAVSSDMGGTDAGEAYVIYGGTTASRTNIDLANLTLAQGFSIQGDAAGDAVGNSVASAGDVNNDGYDDLIVGAFLGDNGGIDAGEAYLIYGGSTASRTNIDLTNLTRAQGFIVQGDAAGDSASVVSAAGDVNHDGYDDLIVGAPYGDNGGISAGEAYVIYGGPQFAVPRAMPSTDAILAKPGNSLTGTCAEFAYAAYVPWTKDDGTPEKASIVQLETDGWTFLTSQTQDSDDFFNVSDLGYNVNATGLIQTLNAGALIARSGDTLVLSITGTDMTDIRDKVDWLNLSHQATLLHELFQRTYDFAAINKLKILVTGHSMGAALAQMFFAEYGMSGDRQVEIHGVNFASPGFEKNVLSAIGQTLSVFKDVTNMIDYFRLLMSSGDFHQYLNENDPIYLGRLFQRDLGNKHDFMFSSGSTGVGPGSTHNMELYLDIADYVKTQRAALSYAGLPSIDSILRDYDRIVVHADQKADSQGNGRWVVGDATGTDKLEGLREGLLDPWIAKREALFGSLADDKINGYGKDDILFGGGGTDFLYGGNGKDILVAGEGGDMLEGDAGKDTMLAAGGDTFIYTALYDSGTTMATADVIVGFDSRTGDKIDLSALGLVEFIGDRVFFDVGQIRTGTMGNDTTIEINAYGDTVPEMIIRLNGVVAFSDTALIL